MVKLKKASLIIQIAGYLLAGANHFRSPDSYIKIIPPYIPFPVVINIMAGLFELAFALLLISAKTRGLAAWGIILMLLAFLPVHLKMVIDAPFMLGALKVTPLIAWIRLVVLQPLLILWAWWYTDTKQANENKI
jgi:uncharacterized membrane protein